MLGFAVKSLGLMGNWIWEHNFCCRAESFDDFQDLGLFS